MRVGSLSIQTRVRNLPSERTLSLRSFNCHCLDTTFLDEMYEQIEQNPPALGARKMVIEHLIDSGELVSARTAVRELLTLDPDDDEARQWYRDLSAPVGPATSKATAFGRAIGAPAGSAVRDFRGLNDRVSRAFKRTETGPETFKLRISEPSFNCEHCSRSLVPGDGYVRFRCGHKVHEACTEGGCRAW